MINCQWCQYTTRDKSNMNKHVLRCKHKPLKPDPEKDLLKDQVNTLQIQLQQAHRTIESLIEAAKDERKRPRVVNNNMVTINNVNIYGDENLDHIASDHYQELLKDPESSISKLVALKHGVEQNKNIKVQTSGSKSIMYIVTETDGKKCWRIVSKPNETLSEMVETNAIILDEKADACSEYGQKYSEWYDRLQTSADDGTSMFIDQMHRVHESLKSLGDKNAEI